MPTVPASIVLLLPALSAPALAAPAGRGAPAHEVPAATSGAHAEHLSLATRGAALRAPRALGREAPPPPPERPNRVVYGYLPYWTIDVADVPWSHLTHLAIFNVDLESDGTLSDTSNWTSVAAEAVALGREHGVKVHVCVTSFDGDVMGAVLASSSRRSTLISELGALVDAYGADGVNVDFEGLEADNRSDMVTFVRELRARVGEVVLATPAVDWSAAWDYAALAEASDGLFILGYGYHWTGGSPGPNAPLEAGDTWSRWTLAWSVEDYLSEGADPAKIIVGLPTYGQEWPVSSSASVPASATDDGWSVTYAEAVADAAAHGRSYDAPSETPWYARTSTRQAWYDDADSLSVKMRWAVDAGLAGFGFWALGYDGDDPALWAAVADAAWVAPTDTGDTAADTDAGGTDTGAGEDEDARPPRPGKAEVAERGGGCGCASPGGAAAGIVAVAFAAAAARRRAR